MMAITGVCLVLFVTFHALMNGVAIFWPQAYNVICAFLGANWYALVASIGLAALFVIHIIYALCLTVQNRKARGNDRYDVVKKPAHVEWSSQNMLVLGIVVLAFLALHLCQFWAKMQLAELTHNPATLDGVTVAPQSGTLFLHMAFSQWWTPVIYIIALVALWFHMNHGFWSMFQTAGWDNDIWMPRLKCIGKWWTTIVVGLFILQAIVFTVQAKNDTYLTCPVLTEQYEEFNAELACEAVPCQAVASCEAAASCQGVCEEATCNTPCDTPCNQPCDKACNKVCDTPCNQPCKTPCDAPCK